jgi:hypothetical protein
VLQSVKNKLYQLQGPGKNEFEKAVHGADTWHKSRGFRFFFPTPQDLRIF